MAFNLPLRIYFQMSQTQQHTHGLYMAVSSPLGSYRQIQKWLTALICPLHLTCLLPLCPSQQNRQASRKIDRSTKKTEKIYYAVPQDYIIFSCIDIKLYFRNCEQYQISCQLKRIHYPMHPIWVYGCLHFSLQLKCYSI